MTNIVYSDPVRRSSQWTWYERLGVIAEYAEPGRWIDITASLDLPPVPANGGGPFTKACMAADERLSETWELTTRKLEDGTRHMYGRFVPTGCCPECGRPS